MAGGGRRFQERSARIASEGRPGTQKFPKPIAALLQSDEQSLVERTKASLCRTMCRTLRPEKGEEQTSNVSNGWTPGEGRLSVRPWSTSQTKRIHNRSARSRAIYWASEVAEADAGQVFYFRLGRHAGAVQESGPACDFRGPDWAVGRGGSGRPGRGAGRQQPAGCGLGVCIRI